MKALPVSQKVQNGNISIIGGYFAGSYVYFVNAVTDAAQLLFTPDAGLD